MKKVLPNKGVKSKPAASPKEEEEMAKKMIENRKMLAGKVLVTRIR